MSNAEIQEHIRVAVELMMPGAEELTQSTGRGLAPTIMTLLRPHVRAALAGAPLAAADGRTAPYMIQAMFWEQAVGETPELVAEADVEQCNGLSQCLARLAAWISELHEGQTLSDPASAAALIRRIGTLRTSLARGAGEGSLRVAYDADGVPHLAHLSVSRR